MKTFESILKDKLDIIVKELVTITYHGKQFMWGTRNELFNKLKNKKTTGLATTILEVAVEEAG